MSLVSAATLAFFIGWTEIGFEAAIKLLSDVDLEIEHCFRLAIDCTAVASSILAQLAAIVAVFVLKKPKSRLFVAAVLTLGMLSAVAGFMLTVTSIFALVDLQPGKWDAFFIVGRFGLMFAGLAQFHVSMRIRSASKSHVEGENAPRTSVLASTSRFENEDRVVTIPVHNGLYKVTGNTLEKMKSEPPPSYQSALHM